MPEPDVADHRRGGAVVFVAGGAVVKLVHPECAADSRGEGLTLRIVAGRVTLPTPALRAEGDLEGWPYLVLSRVPGRSLGREVHTLTSDERREVLRAVGGCLASLHAIPEAEASGIAAVPEDYVRAQLAAAPERQRRWGLPAHLVDEMPGYLDRAGLLDPARAPPVVLHADLHQDNVMVDRGPGGWVASGVIDFGDAVRGPRELDLGRPALYLGRGDREALAAFLGAYGADPSDPRLARRLLAWCLVHPFGHLSGFERGSLGEMERAWFPLA